MPRSARGGARQGSVGVAHANRTDLNANRKGQTQPVVPIRGGVYGTGVQQEANLAANPLPNVPVPTGAVPSGALGAAPPPAQRALPPQLTADSRRPDEPVTAGSPSGPGPGPEVLGLQPPDLSGLLNGLASQSPAVAQLAAYVASGRQ